MGTEDSLLIAGGQPCKQRDDLGVPQPRSSQSMRCLADMFLTRHEDQHISRGTLSLELPDRRDDSLGE